MEEGILSGTKRVELGAEGGEAVRGEKEGLLEGDRVSLAVDCGNRLRSLRVVETVSAKEKHGLTSLCLRLHQICQGGA